MLQNTTSIINRATKPILPICCVFFFIKNSRMNTNHSNGNIDNKSTINNNMAILGVANENAKRKGKLKIEHDRNTSLSIGAEI